VSWVAVGLYLVAFFGFLHLVDRLATRVPPDPGEGA
jgi:hypothetical protein